MIKIPRRNRTLLALLSSFVAIAASAQSSVSDSRQWDPECRCIGNEQTIVYRRGACNGVEDATVDIDHAIARIGTHHAAA